jgi:hypothetical protein
LENPLMLLNTACPQAEAQIAGSNGSSSSSSGDASTSPSSNLLAATIGALATALVESPCELFRHQAQAGLVGGNFMVEMGRAVQRGGPGALYWGFFPFLVESFPYDITELVGGGSWVWGRGSGRRSQAQAPIFSRLTASRALWGASCVLVV